MLKKKGCRRVGFVFRAALFFEKPGRPAGQPRLRNHRNHLGCKTIDVGIGNGIGYWVLDIGFLPKSTLLQKNCFSMSHSPKILRPKILPPNCLTHYLSTISLFPSKKIDSMRICQTNPKIQKSGFNYSLFSLNGQ